MHRGDGLAGRGDRTLAPVQSARNTDRAEQHRLHPERDEDELCLARRGAPCEASWHPVRETTSEPADDSGGARLGGITARATARPREPNQAGGLRPECEGIAGLEIAAECLERRGRLQADQNLLGVAARQTAMNDLDVETWQMCGRRCRVDTSRPRVAPLNSYTVRLHLDEESR